MIPLADSHPAGKFPFWVILIIALNIYVFFLELTSVDPDVFITHFALIPSQLNFSEYNTLIPLITSQFLHGGFLHIISNMLFLWIFGDNVEARLGNLLFPIFYLTSGAVGALTQYFLMPSSSLPMLGASGAIAGVLGAYFAYFPHHTIKTLVPVFGFFTIIDIPASIMLFYWIATQFLSSAFALSPTFANAGGIAYFAHIGSFIFGWLVTKIIFPRNPKEELFS